MKFHLLSALLIAALFPGGLPAADVAELTATIRKIGPQGRGNAEASRAWEELARQNAGALPEILAGMDGAGPLAINWMRSAAEVVADRSAQRGDKLPLERLEAFIRDRAHEPRARRLAFELLAQQDKQAAARMVPSFADDPSVELRRDAVVQMLAEAQAAVDQKDSSAGDKFQHALTAARDPDQVRAAHEALQKLGRKVDLARHFGFITAWKVIGPFDNTGKKGFAVEYPPERKVELDAEYDGKAGRVRWSDHVTSHDYGQVDLNKAIGKHMGAAAYALSFFESEAARPIELRFGAGNAMKVWLNGQLLHTAEFYHANVSMDQYVARGELRPGRNVILVKVCQNEQTEDWAQDWEFRLRVCDRAGTAILSSDRPATIDVPVDAQASRGGSR